MRRATRRVYEQRFKSLAFSIFIRTRRITRIFGLIRFSNSFISFPPPLSLSSYWFIRSYSHHLYVKIDKIYLGGRGEVACVIKKVSNKFQNLFHVRSRSVLNMYVSFFESAFTTSLKFVFFFFTKSLQTLIHPSR